jgi:hypothetical protein
MLLLQHADSACCIMTYIVHTKHTCRLAAAAGVDTNLPLMACCLLLTVVLWSEYTMYVTAGKQALKGTAASFAHLDNVICKQRMDALKLCHAE